jgi:hypothetical protein
LGRNLKKFLNVVVRIDYLNIFERANRWIKELCKFTVMFSVLYFVFKATTAGIQMIDDTRQHLLAVALAVAQSERAAHARRAKAAEAFGDAPTQKLWGKGRNPETGKADPDGAWS